MARRSTPYTVDLGYPEPHRVPVGWWQRYVQKGWLIATGKRSAKLRPGVMLRYINGVVDLLDLATKITASIPSSWRLVERNAMYNDRGPRLSPEAMQREIQFQYGR